MIIPTTMPTRTFFYTILVLLTLNHVFSYVANAITHQYTITVSLEATSKGWMVNVEAIVNGRELHCSGPLLPNTFFRETRAITRTLVVAPLHYVLDSACSRLTTLLASIADGDGVLQLTFRVPEGYYLYLATNRSGNRTLTITTSLYEFKDMLLNGGVVVASFKRYQVKTVDGLVIVAPDPDDLEEPIQVVRCALKFLEQLLGPTASAPRVIVIADPYDHPTVLPGSGFNLGTIVYVKPYPGSGLDQSLLHITVHELVHSWIGHTKLKTLDELLSEGAAELLALSSLRFCLPSTNIRVTLDSHNPYAIALQLHAAIRLASVEACSQDLYVKALRELSSRGMHATMLELLSEIAKLASYSGCRDRFETLLARYLTTLASNGTAIVERAISITGYIANPPSARTYKFRPL